MFDKEIEFSCHEDYFALKEDYPTPIKLNIPEWFKKLEHTFQNKTIKGCMPFLDTLTTGYLLKMPSDLYLQHNIDKKIVNNEIIGNSNATFASSRLSDFLNAKRINLNSGLAFHGKEQLKDSPLIEKNKNPCFHKILNPFKIKTPKGYSCLFLPPLNNSDDRFSIISGIVDTDSFPNEINFPITINGDKYPTLETTIKKGTPYVQIIPFKRDSWKMKITSRKQSEIEKANFFRSLHFLNLYKDKYWNKKKFT
jgi:hypothetical protein